jgi:hypothetical protein
MGAIGAAIMARGEDCKPFTLTDLDTAEHRSPSEEEFPASPPLDLENVQLLRERTIPYVFPTDGGRIDAYMGIDVGSISTNLW